MADAHVGTPRPPDPVFEKAAAKWRAAKDANYAGEITDAERAKAKATFLRARAKYKGA